MDDIQVTNMEEKRAPLITKYECNSATEGFNFVIIENKESEAVYKENVEYTTADGLEIVLGRAPDWDISQQKYEITVQPGETKCVLIRAAI